MLYFSLLTVICIPKYLCLQSTSLFELEKSKVVRVSERFRVIALGLPVPKFRGNPLDPPLRSRFQALDVGPKAFDDQLLSLREIAPSVKQEYLSQLVSFAYAANASELKTQELADFPIDSLSLAATILVKLLRLMFFPNIFIIHNDFSRKVILNSQLVR